MIHSRSDGATFVDVDRGDLAAAIAQHLHDVAQA
jgi:hypothetical protein